MVDVTIQNALVILVRVILAFVEQNQNRQKIIAVVEVKSDFLSLSKNKRQALFFGYKQTSTSTSSTPFPHK